MASSLPGVCCIILRGRRAGERSERPERPLQEQARRALAGSRLVGAPRWRTKRAASAATSGAGARRKPDRRRAAPDTAVVTSTRRLLASSTNRIFMSTTIRRWRIRFAALPIEGVFRRHTEGGARRGVPRSRLVTAAREVRETARQALRPGREELAAGSSGGNAGNRSASRPEIATVERREVRVPSQGTRGASQAPGLPRQMRGNARGCASKTRVNARLTRQAERVLATPVHRLGAPLPL